MGVKRSSPRSWLPPAASIAPTCPSSRTARLSSCAAACGSWIGRRATAWSRGLALTNSSCMSVLYARQNCTAEARSLRKLMKRPSVGKSTAWSMPPLSSARSQASAVPAVSWYLVRSRRSQPSAGTIGKTSCRLRNGASMYFTTCSADSVTWPSASMTVMVATSSRLLADHVEQGLALFLADHLQRAGERPGKHGRVFHALGVAAGGPADQLIVGRRLEVGEHHRASLRRKAVRCQTAHGALHRVPRLVVEDDEEHRHVVRARDEVRRGRRAEDVGAVADRADDGLVRGRSEEHTSELQSRLHLVCRLLLEKKKQQTT